MTAAWKDNISFLLVEPSEPGNIGASARALKNFGFCSMALIKPPPFLTEEARQMACNAGDILESALVHEDLKAALRDMNLVVGTTRRVGKKKRLVLPLAEGMQRIRDAAEKNKVALLFGTERTGLTSREVAECAFLLNIPTDPADPSLNLAQSVLLIAYELGVESYKAQFPKLVRKEQLNDFFEEVERILYLLEYVPRGDRKIEQKIMRNLRHMIGRAGLTEWELSMVRGLCSQVEKRIRR